MFTILSLLLLGCAGGTIYTDTAGETGLGRELPPPPAPRLIVLATCEGIPSIGDDVDDYIPTGWYIEITDDGILLSLDAELSLDPDGLVGLWRCEESAAGGAILYCASGWRQGGEEWTCPGEDFQPQDFDYNL